MNIPGASSRLTLPRQGGYKADGKTVSPVASLAEAFHPKQNQPQGAFSAVLHTDDETTYRIEQVDDRWVVSILDGQGALLRRIPARNIVQMARRLERVMSEGRLGLDATA